MSKRLVSFDDQATGTGLPAPVEATLNATYAPVEGVLDPAGRPLASLVAVRDLPRVVFDLDADDVAGANGSPVSVWPDRSGNGRYFFQATAAKRPTVNTVGRRTVRFGADSFMVRPDLGNGGLAEPAGYAQPNTYFMLVKFEPKSNASARILFSGSTPLNGRNNCYLDAVSQAGDFEAGENSWPNSGAPLDDGQWHVVTAVFGGTFAAWYVDGFLVTVRPSATGTTGVEPMKSTSLGAGTTGALPINGAEIAKFVMCNAVLPPEQILNVTKRIAADKGVTIAAPSTQGTPTYVADTDSGGQGIRYWLPQQVKPTGNTLVIWSHQSGGDQSITPSAFQYPLIHAAANEGWIVAASQMHDNNWGSAAALTDLTNLHTYINSRWGVSKVILVGASMGGLATALAIPNGAVPNIRGCIGIDAAFSLSNMFANSAYTAAIRTAYGIATDDSDYAAKTAGHDPILRPASDFGSVPWRFYVGDGDTTVPPANHGDAMSAKVLATAGESTVVRHAYAHLSGVAIQVSDVVAFIKRCIA
ncbi:hypothetical protein GS551_18575 [Rhodococcus hoagii]|uniref:Alpha/beta hydrolase n=1 Tax=Rhodococcus hoagii TaxID=43767 RepID=A0AAE2W980_RHOHA|nr:hypothetical protein [Prescottella equi]